MEAKRITHEDEEIGPAGETWVKRLEDAVEEVPPV